MDLAYVWFWIVGVLFVGYFVLDGFDFGVGMSLPFLGKDDISRRQIINTIGPVWDLNETWVIVAGACLFAAFPEWYATLFSGFYLALLLILLALILRGVSFEYRHQRDGLRWKSGFDAMIVIGSAVPALLWGVAVANIVQGVPIDAHFEFTGSLLARTAGWITVLVAAIFLIWTIFIAAGRGAPAIAFVIAAAALAAICLVMSIVFNLRDREGWAFGFGAATIVTAVLTLWFALYPNVMVSSTDPANSLTIANASSTPYTLTIMTWAAIIFLPLVLVYQGWTYWIFRKRVSRSRIEKAAASVAH
jgi:cytochrome d ubiquinol oxidase subunit II